MRILLLGKNGQLGWELRRTLATLGEVIPLDYPEVDFTQTSSLTQRLVELHPQVILNAAAYTDVDKAETESELCEMINGVAPGVLAETARNLGSAFIHYSTDYVFDGSKSSPYVETDTPNPISAYAHSKYSGELSVCEAGEGYLILRTSWMYSLRRVNYLKKVLQWLRTHPVLHVVTDHIGSPTSARMLAEITAQMLALGREDPVGWLAEHEGLYHLAGEGSASRYDMALEIQRQDPNPEEQITKEIHPATSDRFPMPARRPLNSALDCSKFASTFGLRLPDWRDAMRLTLDSS